MNPKECDQNENELRNVKNKNSCLKTVINQNFEVYTPESARVYISKYYKKKKQLKLGTYRKHCNGNVFKNLENNLQVPGSNSLFSVFMKIMAIKL